MKLTDNEIIKALEETVKKGDAPVGKHWQLWISTKMAKDILDLINRLQAEIEKLNTELTAMRSAANSYKMHYEKAETEIEKLKKENEQSKNRSTEARAVEV